MLTQYLKQCDLTALTICPDIISLRKYPTHVVAHTVLTTEVGEVRHISTSNNTCHATPQVLPYGQQHNPNCCLKGAGINLNCCWGHSNGDDGVMWSGNTTLALNHNLLLLPHRSATLLFLDHTQFLLYFMYLVI